MSQYVYELVQPSDNEECQDTENTRENLIEDERKLDRVQLLKLIGKEEAFQETVR